MMDDKGRYSFERPKNVPTIDDFGPRRSGRTTRIVDKCIQDFFDKGFVICFDHHPTNEMHQYVQKLVYERLMREHFRYSKGVVCAFRYNNRYIVALKEYVGEAKDAVT